jgi:ethanolamine ammonia-lyase small subunit
VHGLHVIARFAARRSTRALLRFAASCAGRSTAALKSISSGVWPEKAGLRLQYNDSIADAGADLGRPDEIGKVLGVSQKYL